MVALSQDANGDRQTENNAETLSTTPVNLTGPKRTSLGSSRRI